MNNSPNHSDQNHIPFQRRRSSFLAFSGGLAQQYPTGAQQNGATAAEYQQLSDMFQRIQNGNHVATSPDAILGKGTIFDEKTIDDDDLFDANILETITPEDLSAFMNDTLFENDVPSRRRSSLTTMTHILSQECLSEVHQQARQRQASRRGSNCSVGADFATPPAKKRETVMRRLSMIVQSALEGAAAAAAVSPAQIDSTSHSALGGMNSSLVGGHSANSFAENVSMSGLAMGIGTGSILPVSRRNSLANETFNIHRRNSLVQSIADSANWRQNSNNVQNTGPAQKRHSSVFSAVAEKLANEQPINGNEAHMAGIGGSLVSNGYGYVQPKQQQRVCRRNSIVDFASAPCRRSSIDHFVSNLSNAMSTVNSNGRGNSNNSMQHMQNIVAQAATNEIRRRQSLDLVASVAAAASASPVTNGGENCIIAKTNAQQQLLESLQQQARVMQQQLNEAQKFLGLEKHAKAPVPRKANISWDALSNSMNETMKSQKMIQDWDRAMGLRRSHSKTIRNSTRSRKKIQEFLKGLRAPPHNCPR